MEKRHVFSGFSILFIYYFIRVVPIIFLILECKGKINKPPNSKRCLGRNYVNT